MKFIITLLLLIQISTPLSAGLVEKIEEADKRFEAYLKTVDDSLKTSLKKKYQQKKMKL